MFELKGIDLPYKCIYPAKVVVSIDWPRSVTHNGKLYHWYNKLATENDTGMPCACYKYDDGVIDARIWLYCDGRITED